MSVLVACEESGRVTEAFRRRGIEAMSVDLEPREPTNPGPHYQGDVRDVLRDPAAFLSTPIDLVVAHPPCTYLCRAGQRWLNAPDDDRPGKLKGEPRRLATLEAVEFFRLFLDLDVPRIAIENPRPGSHVAGAIGKPDQVVQPWQYGHGEVKATGLWLRNLPPLIPTDVVEGRSAVVHRMPPGPMRQKLRSRTYVGIAEAMAEQWGALL